MKYITVQGGFQLLVFVEHEPRGMQQKSSLVAEFQVEAKLRADTKSGRTNQTNDERGFTEIRPRSAQNQALIIAYRLTCRENYFGANCSVFCVSQDNAKGHFVCTEQGAIECLEGYRDNSTNCIKCVSTQDCSEYFFVMLHKHTKKADYSYIVLHVIFVPIRAILSL